MSSETFSGPFCVVESIDSVDGTNNPQDVLLGERQGSIQVVIQDPDTGATMHFCPAEDCRAPYVIEWGQSPSELISSIRAQCAGKCIIQAARELV